MSDETRTVYVRVPVDLFVAFQAVADREDRSMARTIQRAMRLYLAKAEE